MVENNIKLIVTFVSTKYAKIKLTHKYINIIYSSSFIIIHHELALDGTVSTSSNGPVKVL